MTLIVQKFGGTSVADPERLRDVAAYVARTVRNGAKVVAVVSAMGKETDELIGLAERTSSRRPPREFDILVTAGERKATALLAMALHDHGIDGRAMTGSQAGIITDDNHSRARLVDVRPERIIQALDAGAVPVIAGAQGVSEIGKEITFLGRGGSDPTAVALAHALRASRCELYTDVPGVFSADPRIVPEARRLERVSFDEVLEMCAAGCPKPDGRAVELGRRYSIPIQVRSSFTWEQGTWIGAPDQDDEGSKTLGVAVVCDDTVSKISVVGLPDVPGVAAAMFGALSERDLGFDMVVQNTSTAGVATLSFISKAGSGDVVKSTLSQVVPSIAGSSWGVSVDDDLARVSVVGAAMRYEPGIAARVFAVMADESINIEMVSTAPIRISCLVRRSEAERATVALHHAMYQWTGNA